MKQDFEINGTKYQVRKMDAFKQFHIVRRLAPMLGELAPVLGQAASKAKALEDSSEAEKLEAFGEAVAPIMNGLSKLSDEDANRVLFGLLECAETHRSGAWAPLVVPGGKQMAFQDLDLPTLLQIAARAFAFNLSGFFSALPRVS